jgi:hypothetical protein
VEKPKNKHAKICLRHTVAYVKVQFGVVLQNKSTDILLFKTLNKLPWMFSRN